MNEIKGKITIELTIGSVAYGGMGIARHEGLVHFVPATLPGEKIRAQIVDRKKNYTIAHPEEIIMPSPARIKPACPYFQKCGGCSYLHADYHTQLTLKRQQVHDVITRIAKIQIPPVDEVIPSPDKDHYRNRIALHTRKTLGNAIGFFSTDNAMIVPITKCLIAQESINNELSFVREMFESRALDIPEIRDILLSTDDICTTIVFARKHSNTQNKDCYIRTHTTGELLLTGSAHIPTKEKKIKPFHSFTFNNITLMYSPYTFFQTNTRMLEVLCATLRELINDDVEVLIDAYCGVGVFSLILADKVKAVIGIEENPASERMSRRNATHNKKKIRTINARVEHALGPLLKENTRKVTTLLLDPPRSGLSSRVTKAILAATPRDIIYISCEPTTLARDLNLLSPLYTVTRIMPFDMFPHTKHIETVVVLQRT